MSTPTSTRHLATQMVASSDTATSSVPSSTLDTGISNDLPQKPSSALKKEGWSGFMREVHAQGVLVVTKHKQPEAVVLSVDRYQALARIAQREKVREVHQLAELRASFDQRLASLNAQQANQALDAFMNEPTKLNEELRAGTAY